MSGDKLQSLGLVTIDGDGDEPATFDIFKIKHLKYFEIVNKALTARKMVCEVMQVGSFNIL